MHEPSKLCLNPMICLMEAGNERLLHWRIMVRGKCERWFAVEEKRVGCGREDSEVGVEHVEMRGKNEPEEGGLWAWVLTQ